MKQRKMRDRGARKPKGPLSAHLFLAFRQDPTPARREALEGQMRAEGVDPDHPGSLLGQLIRKIAAQSAAAAEVRDKTAPIAGGNNAGQTKK